MSSLNHRRKKILLYSKLFILSILFLQIYTVSAQNKLEITSLFGIWKKEGIIKYNSKTKIFTLTPKNNKQKWQSGRMCNRNAFGNIDLSGLRNDNCLLSFEIKVQDTCKAMNIQVGLGDAKQGVKWQRLNKYLKSLSHKWQKVSIPLKSFPESKEWSALIFQIIGSAPAKSSLQIKNIAILTDKEKHFNYNIKYKLLDKINDNSVFKKDAYKRPTIKNSTFYENNKPKFMIGPWTMHEQWDRRHYPSHTYHPDCQNDLRLKQLYQGIVNKKLYTDMGFSTLHPQTPIELVAEKYFPRLIGEKHYKRYFGHYDFISSLRGMPIIVDYATFGAYGHHVYKILGKAMREWKKITKQKAMPDLNQICPRMTGFVPFCPENPQGMEIYSFLLQQEARELLTRGDNPWIYELFNEPRYNCQCTWNRNAFKTFLKKRYKNIAKLNKTYANSVFSNFDSVASSKLKSNSGVWSDWQEFIGHQWNKILISLRNKIKMIDQRKNVYFFVQPVISSIMQSEAWSGINIVTEHDSLDALGTEGGVSFGGNNYDVKTDTMNEVMFMDRNQIYGHQFNLDIIRAITPDKPVINSELNVMRFFNGRRMPTRREDIITSLWSEVIHGSSAAILYAWEKRGPQWRSPEEAEKLLNRYPASWLNPKAFSPRALYGIKDFNKELNEVSEWVLPGKRIKGNVAIMISRPTIWQQQINPKSNYLKYRQALQKIYTILMQKHIPVEFIYEEQGLLNLKRFKFIFAIGCKYVYTNTEDKLVKYVKDGGRLFTEQTAFTFDRYGKKRKSQFKKEIENTKYSSLGRKKCGRKYSLNKGILFYLNSAQKDKITMTDIIRQIREYNSDVFKAYIVNGNGKPVYNVELQSIDRGDKKLIFLVNWNHTKLIDTKLGYKLDKPYFVYDLSEKISYGKCSPEKFKQGLRLLLAPQIRKIIVLSANSIKKYEAYQNANEALFKSIKNEISINTTKYLRETANILALRKQRHARLNTFKNLTHAKLFHVNLKPYTNKAFKDDISGDSRGGWTDQGHNDMSGLKTGQQKFGGVSFEIINPDLNNGSSCIVLKGESRKYFPNKIQYIKVMKKAKRLFFLHTLGWANRGEHLRYVIRYANREINIPIKGDKQINDWWSESKPSHAIRAWEGNNPVHFPVCIYAYEWLNPYPDKEILSIDIISSCNGVPIVLAISGEKFIKTSNKK